MTSFMRIGYFLVNVVIVLFLDQISKILAVAYLADGTTIVGLQGVFDFSLVLNDGAAFGMGSGFAWLFVVISLVVIVGCLVYVAVAKPPLSLSIALSLICGGGIGNLIDRLTGGCVIDFIEPTCINFPVFNVADIFITCGFIATLILLWRMNARGRA